MLYQVNVYKTTFALDYQQTSNTIVFLTYTDRIVHPNMTFFLLWSMK